VYHSEQNNKSTTNKIFSTNKFKQHKQQTNYFHKSQKVLCCCRSGATQGNQMTFKPNLFEKILFKVKGHAPSSNLYIQVIKARVNQK